MKKIVVLSDTHGFSVRQLRSIIDESDFVIFCGDGLQTIKRELDDLGDKLIAVRGNCDNGLGSCETIVEVEDVRIFVTHGHLYGVRGGYAELEEAARDYDCSVALFGHTHCAAKVERNGILIFNSGSFADESSYGYMIVNGDKVQAYHVKLRA